MNNIEEYMLESKLILVDFNAKWCGPCRELSILLDNVTDIEVLRVDVDENPSLARKYGVNNIPYLIIMKKGVIVSKHIGLMTQVELNKWILEHK